MALLLGVVDGFRFCAATLWALQERRLSTVFSTASCAVRSLTISLIQFASILRRRATAASQAALFGFRIRCGGFLTHVGHIGRDGDLLGVIRHVFLIPTSGQFFYGYTKEKTGERLCGFPGGFRCGSSRVDMFSPREARVEREKRRGIAVLRVLREGSTTPTVVTSPVGCPRFSVSQAVSSGLVSVLVLYRRVASEAHPYSPQARARRRFRYRLPVQGRAVAVLGQHLQQYSFRSSVVSFLSCTRLPRGMPQAPEVEMADIRDWGGGGEDPEESTQRMIERIWESLTDIRMRMDQQAPVPPAVVPPVAGVPVAPVAPPSGVEVPYVAPVPPPPAMAAEEPVMQVEKFLRLQPPTYTWGPNPDTTEH
ncbi:hypothetical protein Taro_038188 [Colocasia esculenta]|uniref:Uncharacterized protein n=1 Tax=Colocasia esculenta TaxID=4460 RepID=A0A843WD77_COLES|nr:hypothetical protein [Colocasia esculenta]